jgi:Protein of unknown function (DUF2934)
VEEEILMTETAKKATTPKKPRATTAKLAGPDGVASKTAAPRKKTAKATVTAIMVSHEEIARLAHRFWIERGHQHGHHEEDWLRAEQQLLGKAS